MKAFSWNNSSEVLILEISLVLTLSLASFEYHCNDINAIVHRIARIVITTISSTKVKAIVFWGPVPSAWVFDLGTGPRFERFVCWVIDSFKKVSTIYYVFLFLKVIIILHKSSNFRFIYPLFDMINHIFNAYLPNTKFLHIVHLYKNYYIDQS